MSGKISAIVIDDDSLMRELVTRVLEELGCLIVGIGKNGQAAAELYRENKPDLVFLDINMPDVNGLDALRRIFRIDRNARVVMLTGVSDSTVAETCIQSGAIDYLQKDAGPAALRDGLVRAVNSVGG